jgi:hypothetical protein
MEIEELQQWVIIVFEKKDGSNDALDLLNGWAQPYSSLTKVEAKLNLGY